MEKIVYSSYAFTENESEKSKINREIYSELKEKYKCPDKVTLNELALICDGGNLCFGYSGSKKFLSVFED